MLMDTVVVLDFETTGLHPEQGDRITEVAAVRLQNGEVVDRYQSLMNCERRLSNSIRHFTGITQQMIDSAPAAWRVIPELLLFIGYDPVVSHNAAFDQGFLDCECERMRLRRYGEDFICTVQLARGLLPNLDGYSLHSLVRHFKLPNTGQHRAALDAEATAQVLLNLCALAASPTPNTQININALRHLAAPPSTDWQRSNSSTAAMRALRSA
jgi:DNA polymerase III subunit epsilon